MARSRDGMFSPNRLCDYPLDYAWDKQGLRWSVQEITLSFSSLSFVFYYLVN